MSHVLIVDDDSNTRDALTALAAAEGFTTASAGSVAEARMHQEHPARVTTEKHRMACRLVVSI